MLLFLLRVMDFCDSCIFHELSFDSRWCADVCITRTNLCTRFLKYKLIFKVNEPAKNTQTHGQPKAKPRTKSTVSIFLTYKLFYTQADELLRRSIWFVRERQCRVMCVITLQLDGKRFFAFTAKMNHFLCCHMINGVPIHSQFLLNLSMCVCAIGH